MIRQNLEIPKHTVQVKHYRERCHRLEGHLHSAHNLLKEAAGTLTEDEIDQMDGDAGFSCLSKNCPKVETAQNPR